MNHEHTIEITSTAMLDEVLEKTTPTIIYVSTPQCNVCKSVYPKMMDVVSSYDVTVYEVDASTHQDIAGQLLVFSIPTIIVRHDQKEVYKESRFIQFDQFKRVCALACERKA